MLPNEDLNSPQYERLTDLLRRGLLELTRQCIAELEGDFSGEVTDKLFKHLIEGERTPTPQPVHSTSGKPSITLEELKDRFFAHKGHDPKNRKNLYNVMWEIMRQQFGADKPIRDLTRDDFRSILDLVKHLPKRASSTFPDYTYKQASDAAKRDGLEMIDPGTADSYLSPLRTMMKFAVQEDLVDRNLTEGLTIKASPQAKKVKVRHSFKSDQLTTMFKAPIYTGCRDGFKGYARVGTCIPNDLARYWAPLVSLFTGMRMGEILQLHTADVREEDGVWCIFITTEINDDGELEAADLKRVKTAAGERFVPIHPELRRIGFTDHVKLRQMQRERRLFPELTLGNDGYFSHAYSKWFARFLEKLNIKGDGICFHSFRHTFRDRMRAARLDRDKLVQLGGWSKNDIGLDDHYGDGDPPSVLIKEVEKITFPDLDLSHLYRK